MNKELLINRESEEELDIIRHDCAHVLAEAVQSLYSGTQVTIGPTIENGFYYDFFREKPFTSDDLIVIEKKMREIVNKGENFKREVWTQKKAIDYFSKKGETYKVELVKDIPEDIPEFKLKDNIKLVDFVFDAEIVDSKSEIKRLIKQGGVKIDDIQIKDIHFLLEKNKYKVIKIGKRKFLKIV